MTMSRRELLQSSAALAGAAGSSRSPSAARFHDGPASSAFQPVPLAGNIVRTDLPAAGLSAAMSHAAPEAPWGSCVAWGIPFHIDRFLVLKDPPVAHTINLKAEWLVFLHTSDLQPVETDAHGFTRAIRGEGQLGLPLADYVILYADGTEVRETVRGRHQIGTFSPIWGENCFQAVAHSKPFPVRPVFEQPSMPLQVGENVRPQTRVAPADRGAWVNWLWAWRNPHPEKAIAALRFEPKVKGIVISAVSAGQASDEPLRWQTRRKAILTLPEGMKFDHQVDGRGQWSQIQLDLGQVISAEPRRIYPDREWSATYDNMLPQVAERDVLIEYTAHPDAQFHLWDGTRIRVADLEQSTAVPHLTPIPPATHRVKIRVLNGPGGKPMPVKLHLHGAHGEYLAPVDRHRQPNTAWCEDSAPEFQHQGAHRCVYIDGETIVDLPSGVVYLEVSKGFEIKPVRMTISAANQNDTVEIVIPKALAWREKGWVTADTHVHFLSPSTALLEGCAEGVNVVNLLASQWGELMTNAGDFDGKTTFGSKEAGGDGEWLVRVGTENRQHVLGHISLLGYNGSMIAPMCSGGPNEAALGDPIEILLMEWAEQCKSQDGLVILPHFPNPRCENAADIIGGVIDAVEMTSWGNLYAGIDPYSLSDYYRYLNCGYFVAAVGGTDKMAATTAVGTVRTYARIPSDREFTYDTWKAAVRTGNTFVTYGPLMDFSVDGRPPGSKLDMSSQGGTIDITWDVASVTVPMTKVELIINGEVRESRSVQPDHDSGNWSISIAKSSWVALLVRGHYPDQREIIAAHSSPVMIHVAGSQFYSAMDAVTMLDQIEGALAYIDTVGTRAQNEAYKRIRLKLISAYRELHNRLHQQGHYHQHAPGTAHNS